VSISSTVARVAELQALIAGAPSPTGGATAPAPTAPSASPAGFAGALADASTASPATAPVAADASLVTGTGTGAATGSSLAAGVPYGDEITAAARRHGIDPALLAGLIRQESGFNANAVSPAGARGLTQLMPGTAAGLGVANPSDPAQAIEGGAKYLAQQLQRFGGDTARALAAYNAGPGAVERFGGVPPYAETQAYVRRVQAYAAAYRTGRPA
jgi:soluble lytic murein transglycosylase-like protein